MPVVALVIVNLLFDFYDLGGVLGLVEGVPLLGHDPVVSIGGLESVIVFVRAVFFNDNDLLHEHGLVV